MASSPRWKTAVVCYNGINVTNSIVNEKGEDMLADPGYYVGWGTLSLINAGLAQSKGRSGFLWWVLSLFLGPIATFLIVVLPDVEEEVIS